MFKIWLALAFMLPTSAYPLSIGQQVAVFENCILSGMRVGSAYDYIRMEDVWAHQLTFHVEKADSLVDSDVSCRKYIGKTLEIWLRNDETAIPPDSGESFIVQYQHFEDAKGNAMKVRSKIVELKGSSTLK